MTSAADPGRPPDRSPGPKAGHGCLIACLLAGAVGVVFAVGGVWIVLRTARAQRDVVRNGAGAPGISELREIGCDPGTSVVDSRPLRGLGDGGPAAEATVLIACLATEGHRVPTCDDVARTYAAAVHPSGTFVAEVQVVRRFRIECRRVYAGDGRDLGEATW